VAPVYGSGATLVFKYSKGFKEIAEKGYWHWWDYKFKDLASKNLKHDMS
jgi:hypothetical protein